MDINPINDATAKVVLGFGVTGSIAIFEAYVIYKLMEKLAASQETRVAETKEMLAKYEALVDKVHDTLDQLISAFKGGRRGK